MTISATTQGLRPGVCTSSNRPATPFEGQMIYETDTDLTYIYGGSAWQQVAGGTAVGNSGLVYISTTTFAGSTAAQFQSCFTSTYTNYHVLISYNAASANATYLRWLVGSTVQTGNILSLSIGASISGGASVSANNRSDQYALFPAGYPTYPTTVAIDIFSPQVASYTSFNYGNAILGTSNTDAIWAAGGGRNIATTQIDGFEVTTAGGPNLSGTMTLYGYRK